MRALVALAFALGTAGAGAAGAATAGAGAAGGDAFRLGLPVRCAVGTECFIQNYVDRDPGPGWRDYACGALSYDGHLGTDFRVASLAAMRRGVEVVAAAAGTVAAVRDGEPDLSVAERGRETILGREAGNGVRIDHGGGWETQYSHLLRGSVRVRPGQRVRAGEVLGMIGISGNTEFPHLDFVVRRSGRVYDPFAPQADEAAQAAQAAGAGRPAAGTSASASAQCADGPSQGTLWHDGVREQLRYRTSAVLIAGFSTEAPERGKAQRGDYDGAQLARDAPAVVFWVETAGIRKGDVETLEVRAPDGAALARRVLPFDGDLAVRFSFVGRRRGAEGWPEGVYRGRYRLVRGEAVVLERELDLVLR